MTTPASTRTTTDLTDITPTSTGPLEILPTANGPGRSEWPMPGRTGFGGTGPSRRRPRFGGARTV
ncbi:hypothetical protein GCM10009547_32810 [Sporichthya brevicatena]|uniref:Uncharacterized protein n=1 Tax=Sporichthya brevicatena TaxID=171442 RepID=A0ABN1H1Z2_9ACTN